MCESAAVPDSLLSSINKAAGQDFEYQDKFSPGGKTGLLYTSLDRKGLMFHLEGGRTSRIDYWNHIRIDSKGYPETPDASIMVSGAESEESVAKAVARAAGAKISEAGEEGSLSLPAVVNGKPVNYGTTPEEADGKSIERENEKREVTPEFLKEILQDKLAGMLHGDFDGLLIHGDAGVGKPARNSCKIKTPSGWTTHGEIKVGNEIITPDGSVAVVSDVFPQGVINLYRVFLANGANVDVGIEHLWQVFINGIPLIATTKDIIEQMKTKDCFIPVYGEKGNSLSKIASIEQAEDGEATCIQVDSQDHLYITDCNIITHNTFPVKKFLKEHNIKYRKFSGTITTAGLFMALWENRHKDKWLFFDDIDSVFGDEACRNMLKAALDTARDEREITYKTKNNSFDASGMTDEQMEKAVADSGGRKYPDKFLFQGKIIFISNLKTSQIEAAILSRTQKVNYELTHAQIWDLTDSMIEDFEIARNPPTIARKLVLELMKQNWKLKEKPNFRVFMSACATYMRVFQATKSDKKAADMVLYEIGGLG